MDTAAPPINIERLKSWLPVDAVIRNGRPGIEWLDMSGVFLTEPFFTETVARVRKERAASHVVTTDLEALIQLEKVSDSLKPSGFIFHTSRCGSTLMANACRVLNDSLVIAEAPVVDKLISRFFTDTNADPTKELLYSVLARGAISALGQRRFGNERHYFIKFASISFLQFHRIRKIWPSVPAVFLFRNPIEVMVSNMRSVPHWMNIDTNPATAGAIIGLSSIEVKTMSPEEFCARTLGRYYEEAETLADERTLLLNYDELTPQAVLGIVRFFGVAPSAEEAKTISETCRLYSKDPTRSEGFQADGASKRADASEYIKKMAERWALPSYQRLNELLLRRNAAEGFPLSQNFSKKDE